MIGSAGDTLVGVPVESTTVDPVTCFLKQGRGEDSFVSCLCMGGCMRSSVV